MLAIMVRAAVMHVAIKSPKLLGGRFQRSGQFVTNHPAVDAIRSLSWFCCLAEDVVPSAQRRIDHRIKALATMVYITT